MKRKHTLRSLLSMVCTIAMILSLVPVLPAAAASDVFYDNMESYTVGTDLYEQAGDKYTKTSPAWGNANYTAASQGNVAVVTDPANSTNKVLAVTAAGQSKRYILTPAPEVTGDYTLQFDYMSPTAASNLGSAFLDIYINDGRNQIARMNHRNYGSYFYLDSASASPAVKMDTLADNTWYSVRVVVAEDEYTMDIWEKGAMEDTLISTTATKYQKANAGTNVEFCFGPYDSAWGMNTSNPIVNYIDNIRITPGVVESADSAKDDGTVSVAGGGMITFADAHKIVNTQAVAITAGMGLFAGTSEGKFDPTGTVTRAQMATIIVKMLRGNAFNADNFKGFNKFSDTADYQGGWAEGYINACVQMGVVSGYGDGTFKPEKAVTTAEALTMIINALKVDAGEGEWPATIMAKAQEMKLYGDLAVKPGTNDALTRDQLAVLTYEGMCYSPSGVTGYKIPGTEIIFTDIADAMKANGGVTGITEVIGEDALANKVYELKIAEGYIVENQANTDNEYTVVRTVKDDGTYEDYQFNMETELGEIGHYVTVYYREGYKNEKEPGVVYNYVDETQVVTVKEAITTSKDYKEAFGKSIKTAKIMIDLAATYDWKTPVTTLSGYAAGTTAKTGTYFIYEGEIVGYMPLVPVYAAKVRAVNTFDGNETIELSSVTAPISNSADNDRVIEYAKIAKDDYVTYVVVGSGANATYVLSKITTTKGSVTKTSVNEDGANVITMKEVEYPAFAGAAGAIDVNRISDLSTDVAKISYTDTYTLYITEGGEYVGFEKTVGGLNLDETVFILGELKIVTEDGYGGKVRKTTARGIDMKGNEVNLLLKVEKNGTVETDIAGNEYYQPSLVGTDNIAAPTYEPLTPNTFYTYELSNDKDAKKEGIYVLTAYATAYDKDDMTTHIYSGTRLVRDGEAYAFSNFPCNGKNTYYHSGTTYILLEGSVNQNAPLTAEVKKSWATSTNTTGADMVHYYLFSRNESDAQMLDVALVVADNALSASGTQAIYVSEVNRTPVGSNADGYVFAVYDYKTGAKKEITVKTNDPVVVRGNGKIPEVGYWHTIPEAGTSRSILVEKVADSGSFSGSSGNATSGDKLYNENIAHNQRVVELMDNELNTTSTTRLSNASSATVVDTRTEEDIEAAGLGKISTMSRLGTLAVDHPEVVVIFDLCYSTSSRKVLTIFVKDVYFTSVDGAEIVKDGSAYYLDGRVVDAKVQITDKSGRLRADVSGTDDTAALVELTNSIANNSTVNVTYAMTNGKVTGITITGILDPKELYVETFESYAAGSIGTTIPAAFEKVWIPSTSEGANYTGTYTFDIDEDNGNQSFKVTNTEGKRVWLKPAGVYSGNYTFETKVKVGDTNNVLELRWRNIDLAGTENDYSLRIDSSGTLYQVYGVSKIANVPLTRNTWYKVVVTVDETNGTVKTEVYDNTGALLTSGTEACGNFSAHETVGPTIDFNAAGTYYVDDIIITRGEEIVSGATNHEVSVAQTENGLIYVNGAEKATVVTGDPVTVTATIKGGYEPKAVYVNGEIKGNTLPYTFNMPNEDVVVKVEFQPSQTYAATQGECSNGTISFAPASGNFGASVTATMIPDDGYVTKFILVDGEIVAEDTDSYSFTLTGNPEVSAIFWPEGVRFYDDFANYTVNGELPVDDGMFWASHNTPADEAIYDRKVVTEDGADALLLHVMSTGSSRNRITVKTVESFTGSYVVETRVKTDNPYVTCLRLTGVKIGGEDVEFRFGKGISYMYPIGVDCKDTNGNYITFNAGEWYTLRVIVDKDSGDVCGAVYSADGTTLVGSATLTGAAVNEGVLWLDHFSANTGTGESNTWFDYITVKPIPTCAVTVDETSVPTNCTVKVNNEDSLSEIMAGQSVTITATYEAADYTLNGFTVNGTAATKVDDNTYTFTMPFADAVVVADFYEFTKGEVTLDAANGTFNGITAGTYTEGDKVENFTVTANDGYRLVSVTGNGVVDNGNGTYTFTMPTPAQAVTITATFEEIRYSTVAFTGFTTDEGSVAVTDEADKYADGTTVTFTVTAKPGYSVDTVTADNGITVNGGTNGVYTIDMPAAETNITVTVTFMNDPMGAYTVDDSNKNSGTATATKTGDELSLYTKGSSSANIETSLTVATKETKQINGLELAVTVNVSAPHAAYASIKLADANLELKFNKNGSVQLLAGTEEKGNGTYTADTEINVTFTIDSGTVVVKLDDTQFGSAIETTATETVVELTVYQETSSRAKSKEATLAVEGI